MMAVLLIGMMVIVPENAQAATQQVKFIDGYSKKPTTDQMINGMVNWYRIKLPENWKYTDKNVTIKVSNKSVAYLEYEKSEPDGFYLCANYEQYFVDADPYTDEEIVEMAGYSFDDLNKAATSLSIDDVISRHSN